MWVLLVIQLFPVICKGVLAWYLLIYKTHRQQVPSKMLLDQQPIRATKSDLLHSSCGTACSSFKQEIDSSLVTILELSSSSCNLWLFRSGPGKAPVSRCIKPSSYQTGSAPSIPKKLHSLCSICCSETLALFQQWRPVNVFTLCPFYSTEISLTCMSLKCPIYREKPSLFS